MADKLSYLRMQAAAYLRDAATADNEREAARLVMLAVRCQETILDLEQQTSKPPSSNPDTQKAKPDSSSDPGALSQSEI
jgi:hypothetical protein